MKELKLKVNLEEANLIFKALGTLPFQEVYEVIGKLNSQINQQTAQNGIQMPSNGENKKTKDAIK